MSNRSFATLSDSENDLEPTLTRKVYESLRDEITTGILPPGMRLVRRAVGKRLGVSHLPVAEALFLLEQDGLVESAPLCGHRVRPLTLDVYENELELREALECHVARRVAERASDKDLSDILPMARRLDGLMRKADPTATIGRELHMEFHLRLAHLSGMPLLERELRRAWLRKMMDITWLSATRLMRIPEQWHVQLVEAIATRNPDIAERAARGHVQYGTDTVRESLRGTTQNLQSLSQKGSNADAETI